MMPPEEDTESDSIRDAINKAINGEEIEGGRDVFDSPPEPESPVSLDDIDNEEGSKEEVVEAPGSGTKEEEKLLEEEEAVEDEDESESEEAQEALPAPHSWTTEEKERFRLLPKDVQEVIHRRERERDRYLTERSQQIAQQEKQYKELEETIAPHLRQWNLSGYTPAQVIRSLVEMQGVLNENPVNGLQMLAQSYGIDSETLSKALSGEKKNESAEVRELRQELQRVQSQVAAQQQASYQAVDQQVLQEVNAFQSATDEKGQPIAPYFNELQSSGELGREIEIVMAERPQASTREILSEAYNRAAWANPGIRENLIHQEAMRRVQAGAEKARVATARKAKKSVSGSPTVNGATEVPEDVRSTIEAAFSGELQ